MVNQLRALLEIAFPAAIGLFARPDSDVAIAFLRRYPTQHAAAHADRSPLRRVLAPHRYCGRKPVERAVRRGFTTPQRPA